MVSLLVAPSAFWPLVHCRTRVQLVEGAFLPRKGPSRPIGLIFTEGGVLVGLKTLTHGILALFSWCILGNKVSSVVGKFPFVEVAVHRGVFLS